MASHWEEAMWASRRALLFGLFENKLDGAVVACEDVEAVGPPFSLDIVEVVDVGHAGDGCNDDGGGIGAVGSVDVVEQWQLEEAELHCAVVGVDNLLGRYLDEEALVEHLCYFCVTHIYVYLILPPCVAVVVLLGLWCWAMQAHVALADGGLVALAEVAYRQAEAYHIPLCALAEHQDGDLLDVEGAVVARCLVVVHTLDGCGIHIHIIYLFDTLPVGDAVAGKYLVEFFGLGDS